jgi:glycosyltransferase involved in cell wall biosynthesis
VQLIITGEGKAKEFLKQRAKELNLSDQVSFLDWLSIDELYGLISICDIGLEPYRRPWPQNHTPSLKVASYLAAKLFVLATKAPGYDELFQCTGTGLLYTTQEELRNFLERAIADRSYVKVSNSHVVREKVDIRYAVDQFEPIINELIVRSSSNVSSQLEDY